MIFNNYLLHILAVFIIQTKCDQCKDDPKNDDTSTDDVIEVDPSLPTTGESVCYYFAYDSLMNIEVLQKQMPSAKLFNKGILSGFSLGFTTVGEEAEKILTTLIPDEASQVLGLIFEVSVDDYFPYLDRVTIYQDKKVSWTTVFSVKVDVNGGKNTVRCNTLVASEEILTKEDPIPKYHRPTKDFLKSIVKALEAAHMDKGYIQKIANFPTQ